MITKSRLAAAQHQCFTSHQVPMPLFRRWFASLALKTSKSHQAILTVLFRGLWKKKRRCMIN